MGWVRGGGGLGAEGSHLDLNNSAVPSVFNMC